MSFERKQKIKGTKKEDLIKYHFGWGMGIRNSYGLWKGNTELLKSCGGEDIHPDSCSMVIINRVWDLLQIEQPL